MSSFKLQFTLPGQPLAKQRHRTVRTPNRPGRHHSYDPQQAIKDNMREEMKITLGSHYVPTLLPLLLTFDAFFPRNKGHYGTGKNSNTVKPSAPQHHIVKPDYDNLVKFYKDVMNGIIYKDDSQVVGMGPGRKHYIEQWESAFVRIKLVSLD